MGQWWDLGLLCWMTVQQREGKRTQGRACAVCSARGGAHAPRARARWCTMEGWGRGPRCGHRSSRARRQPATKPPVSAPALATHLCAALGAQPNQRRHLAVRTVPFNLRGRGRRAGSGASPGGLGARSTATSWGLACTATSSGTLPPKGTQQRAEALKSRWQQGQRRHSRVGSGRSLQARCSRCILRRWRVGCQSRVHGWVPFHGRVAT